MDDLLFQATAEGDDAFSAVYAEFEELVARCAIAKVRKGVSSSLVHPLLHTKVDWH